ncbi:alpha/beta hydrolase family protein [Paraferrimonas haliotis]|uniref:Peptidase S9 n=1 Tax=Paraferrimonas haliotis TaxID=2013866 RepID=A0AA37TSW7_9GAMM|nr:S9 family peptidase [Paraferrimonas haliotis]GLS83592.1 peptidase S9 [Paraferrimonas haliotis]
MIRMLFTALLLALFSLPAAAQTALSDFAKHPMFSGIKISPSGDYYAAKYPQGDEDFLAIMSAKDFKILCRFTLEDKQSVGSFYWASDERVVFNEIQKYGQYAQPFLSGNLYAGNADCSQRKVIFGPKSKEQQAAVASIVDLMIEDDKNILISSNFARRQYANLYRLDTFSGRLKLVEKADFANASLTLDHERKPLIATVAQRKRSGITRARSTGEVTTYYRASMKDDWKEVAEVDQSNEAERASMQVFGFIEDNSSLLVGKNDKQPQRGLFELDPKTGKTSLLYQNQRVDASPQWRGLVDPETGYRMSVPVGARINDGYPETIFFDENSAYAKEYRSLEAAFPKHRVSIASSTKDDSIWIIRVSSDVNPGEYYKYDRQQNKLSFLLKPYPWLDKKQMSEMTPVDITARDGLLMQGYLTIPKGSDGKNLPLIIHPHGGPYGPRDYWGYNPEVQVMASRGYAVLQVNFRGSGGYGREFQNIGFGEWGLKMQDDLTDATLWAIEQGIADKDRICISGASYGGYAALQGVVREPDLYQCAVGYVGVYDLPLMLEEGNVAERLDWGPKYLEKAFGTDKAHMKAISPVYHVDKIKAPVFIVHGGKDLQAHYENAYRLRDALEKAGKEYEWMFKRTEGHGFYDETNRAEYFEAIIKFFDKHIGK